MTDDDLTLEEKRKLIAQQNDRSDDPLADLEGDCRALEEQGIDFFEMFLEEKIPDDRAESTYYRYRKNFRQWREFMAEKGRHPACPNENHVKEFIKRNLEKNKPGTVKEKVREINAAFKYWQDDNIYAHGTDYNPVDNARTKVTWPDETEKEYPHIDEDELAESLEDVGDYRDLAIIVLQIKLGLRAGELSNVKLKDVNLDNDEIKAHYPELGSHPKVEDRPNAVYVPSRDDRDGNKSKEDRILPLDEEVRLVLTRWLLVRPDNGEEWLILSKDHHEKIQNAGINDAWKAAFWPRYEFGEDSEHRSLKSHFGRHFFTSYWDVRKNVNETKVKYMRGDIIEDGPDDENSGAINVYRHAYYEDIEPVMREEGFSLGLI